MPKVLYADPLGCLHNAPCPSFMSTRLDPLNQSQPQSQQRPDTRTAPQSQQALLEELRRMQTPFTRHHAAKASMNNSCTTACQDSRTPLPSKQIVNPAHLATPRRTYVVSMEGVLAMPDAAMCITLGHLDKHSKMQLAYTCKAMAQAVFTRQLKQATLVVKDKHVGYRALLTVLSWLPVSAWHLGNTNAAQIWAKASNQLDRLLGLSDKSILTSSFADLRSQLTEEQLLYQWDAYFSGGTWQPTLLYTSVVTVTLQGMALAFVVPPALAIACPNLRRLTLMSCSVTCVMDKSWTPSALLDHRQGRQYSHHATVLQLVRETVCVHLEILELIDSQVMDDWCTLTPDMSKRNMPKLKELRIVRSEMPDTYLGVLGTNVGILDYQRAESHVLGLGLGLGKSQKPIGGFMQSEGLLFQLTTRFTNINTLILLNQVMCGSEFVRMESMPKLRSLAVCGFSFTHDEDFRQRNTHLQNLHIDNVTMDLTTLGRLPLHSLKMDPVSGRPYLKIILPYQNSKSEAARAINNLKGCRAYPITINSLWLEAHANDQATEESHAAMLLSLLTSFKANTDIRLSKLMLGESFIYTLHQPAVCGVKALKLQCCQIRVELVLFWQRMLRRFPSMQRITVERPTPHSSDEMMQLVKSLSQAWASVQHRQPLSVTMDPSATTMLADLQTLWGALLVCVPSSVDLTLHPTTVRTATIPPPTPTGTLFKPEYVDRPAVVAKIGPAPKTGSGTACSRGDNSQGNSSNPALNNPQPMGN